MTYSEPAGRSADFQICRIADFQVGGVQRCVRIESQCIRRFGNLRYGRFGNPRYVKMFPSACT